MRASEFILNEGRSSRRKQARMNARRRAPAAAAVAPQPDQANTAGAGAFGQMAGQMQARPSVSSTGGTSQQTAAGQRHTASATNPNQPAEPATAPAEPATAPATAPAAPAAPAAKPKFLDRIKSKFNASDQVSRRTDKIFLDKFNKDIQAASLKSTSLNKRPLDLKAYASEYLAKNNWANNVDSASMAALTSAINKQDTAGIATAILAIGRAKQEASPTPAAAPAAAAPAAAAPAAAAPAAPAAEEPLIIGGQKIMPGTELYNKVTSMVAQQKK